MSVTFITGNKNKAEFLEKYLGYPVKHKKLDLDEIQNLDSREIIKHKSKQAFKIVGSPILVEDVSVAIKALGRLPGPFIKWFEQELGLDGIIKLLANTPDRSASVKITYGYFDGKSLKVFEDEVFGSIAMRPERGSYDFGWNPIFIPKGSTKTFAQMNEQEIEKYSLRTRKVYPQLKVFLTSISA